MESEQENLRLVLLEIVGRKFFNLLRQVGDASLISRWNKICDSSFDIGELQKLIDQGKDEIVQASICGTGVPLTSSLQDVNLSSVWNAKQMQPIEVIVDENHMDFEMDNQPSTSSSVISSQADTQQDAKIYSRIGELRNAGLWSSTRLPICVEPPRVKLHWDFLLEEVLWMSSDFRQERRIKRRLARKLSFEARHQWKKRFESKNVEHIKREREREGKRVCTLISRMMKEFWLNVDKVVNFRTKEILNSQKRKALDQHLTFLVSEADKLSTLLHERLAPDEDRQASPSTSGLSDRGSASLVDPDGDDFEVSTSEEDDETTIANEEISQNKVVVDYEISELSKEADMGFDDFLSTLPKEYLEQFALVNKDVDKKVVRNATIISENIHEKNSDVKENTNNLTSSKPNLVNALVAEDKNASFSNVNYKKLTAGNSEVRRQELNNIAEVALEFQPKGFTLETTQVKTEVPFLLQGSLREYQLVGLDWLVTLYEKNLNGILADEMGLGKTIQTVSLLAHLACEKMIWGPHLIIVPTSVILNWEMELKKWCPSFKILTYFGNAKERAEKRKGWSKNNAFHICVTSYNIASQDIKALKMKAWQYMILDEAQNIKNFKSQRWQTLLNIRSRRRLLLTGTPLQNSLMELWSLLHFLMPSVFASHEDFKEWFSNPMTSMVEGNIEVDNALVQRLHKVLRPFILRRLKSEVETQLPTKQEKIISCALSKRQRYLYNEFLSRKTTRENLQSGNVMGVLNVIMQLRKCCNHPNLFESRPVLSPFVVSPLRLHLPVLVYIDVLKAGEICSETDLFLSKSTFQINMSSTFYDWKFFKEISSPNFFLNDFHKKPQEQLPKLKGLKFCADQKLGNGAIFLRSASQLANCLESNEILEINDKEFDFKKIRISTLKNGRKRPVSMMINGNELAQQNSQSSFLFSNQVPVSKRACRFENILLDFRRKRQEENCLIGQWLSLLHRLKGAPSISEETVSIVHKYFHLPDSYSSTFFLVENSGPFYTACQMISSRISEWTQSSIKSFILYVNKLICEGPIISVNSKAYDCYNEVLYEQVYKRTIIKHNDMANAVYASHNLQFPELRLIEYDCGKLQVLSKLLVQLYENKHRCLIFTQMSKMLDILQAFLSYHNYKYFRLDGSTHIDQRQAMMERFNNDNSVFCFILSTRSGGVGVNLTGADTVIFYDSDWNPTMDAQAQDRCHRIGQTRNVTIYRLISEKTIEENILKKAMQKRRLGEMALDEAEFTPEFFRNTNNIRDLFSNEESVKEIVAPFSSDIQGVKDIEDAMANAEDQQDVIATRKAQAEATVDVAEFDENSTQFQASNQYQQKFDVVSSNSFMRKIDSPSEQYLELISGLTPVERYAVGFLENEYGPELEEEVKEAEALIVAKKEIYLKNSEGSVSFEADDVGKSEVMVLADNDTYDEDFIKEVFPLEFCFDAIPTWMPPSPPNSEVDDENFVGDGNKFYFTLLDDHAALYESKLIPELKLPPLLTPTAAALSQLSAPSVRHFSRFQNQNHHQQNHKNDLYGERQMSPGGTLFPSTISTLTGFYQKSGISDKHSLKSRKHLRRQIAAANGQQVLKKSRSRQLKNNDLGNACDSVDSKVYLGLQSSLIIGRGAAAPLGGVLSPPESLPSTPSMVCSDITSSGTTSVYDSAMISALNNVGSCGVAGGGLSSVKDTGFPQKFDESIERVRRNSVKKHLVSYVSADGPQEYRHEILHYLNTPANPSTSSSSSLQFLRSVNDTVHQLGGFTVPDLAGEAPDYEGMPWCCEEDRQLLTAVVDETKLTPKMIGELPALDLNWHFVASFVNAQSKQHRSPKQCFYRYWNIYMRTSGALVESQSIRFQKQFAQSRLQNVKDNTLQRQAQPSVAAQTSYAVYFDEGERIRQITAAFQRRANAVQNAVQMRKLHYYSSVAAIQQRAAAFSSSLFQQQQQQQSIVSTIEASTTIMPTLVPNISDLVGDDSSGSGNESRANMIIQILRNAQTRNRPSTMRGN